ncbi:Delta(24)-sterol C-methyltransferase [Aspergillus melleus]|uniref:Delta(24)-sterol C-methyltransferase n=1 Tax=Aspergillus melleus TaxID=138277 RepID=A0ACC3BB06_9EURO|nr:Delta(24)-sterol C-methyltransferase [Aspergillus melleus]
MTDTQNQAEQSAQFYEHGTSLIEHIFGSFIHVFRLTPGETLANAVTRHEHYLALWLKVNKDQKVLDIGCGNGGPTREIARFLDVNVVGVDLEEHHVQHAKRFTTAAKLEDRVSFKAADFMDMKLEEASFDGAYSIEATAYAPDLQAVYAQVFKFLRPGARFAVYEPVLASKYRDGDPEHREIRRKYEQVFAAPPLREASAAVEAMKAAGFEMELAEDLAERPGSMPWYSPIDGSYGMMASVSDTFAKNYYSFLMSSFRSRGILYYMTGALEKFRILPSGTRNEAVQIMEAMDSLLKAGERGIVTPMFLMVGRKPEA